MHRLQHDYDENHLFYGYRVGPNLWVFIKIVSYPCCLMST